MHERTFVHTDCVAQPSALMILLRQTHTHLEELISADHLTYVALALDLAGYRQYVM